uniref:hypothetical protein n=1 Tax=Vibrio cholerae TaxID=666 RepID=UPI003D2FB768
LMLACPIAKRVFPSMAMKPAIKPLTKLDYGLYNLTEVLFVRQNIAFAHFLLLSEFVFDASDYLDDYDFEDIEGY